MTKRLGGKLQQHSRNITKTQLIPLLSARGGLVKGAYLLPVIITMGFTVAMFMTLDNPAAFKLTLGIYLALACYYFIYLSCHTYKPWYVLVGAALFTIAILETPLLELFVFVFRDILPGSQPGEEYHSFWKLFIRMLFGAGLMEELIKALPVFFARWLGTCCSYPLRERVGVWGPLDGILLGAASAVGFTLFETLGQYVPLTTNKVGIQYGTMVGELAGLQLLIPRMLSSVGGHMAFSGYMGYFIGLSVLNPGRTSILIGVGYLSSAVLHALWNSSSALGAWAMIASGGLSYAFLAAAILKARQITNKHGIGLGTSSTTMPPSPLLFALHLENYFIDLYLGKKITTSEIKSLASGAANRIVAEVNQNPRDPSILGLKNLSNSTWYVVTASSVSVRIMFGQSVRLTPGTRIHFGTVEGEICHR
ncbi:MAG: PrsW family intramembrane metalloprotease [Syntrophobacteraceae bacterium]